ncbi:extracellular repeat protein, HAF family [Burkholderia sp. lig30]|jgi:probable HAF family extracellular repeat protein|uniref:hypothetical protein n=1 Tax=Burkholderia sp. lig30 TaxID=1192124 RepID=UPI00046180E2|nr:hypothetical protein [Burkholderia sp. lig30]KDB10267.1 extracellular repeat protein, HAF family [Burkholderia sp. lig30]
MPSECKRSGVGYCISRAVMIFALISFQACQPASAYALAIQDLGTPSGGDYSSAGAINDSDQVVGESASAVDYTRAFLYQDRNMIMGAGIGAATKLFRVNPRTGNRVVLGDSGNPAQGPAFSAIDYLVVVPDKAGEEAP